MEQNDDAEISIEEVHKDLRHFHVVDVRSPSEFLKGCIPGALNIPLFSDEERATVGIEYKKEGQSKAIAKGLEFSGPKMVEYLKKAKQIDHLKPLLVYCWRGGKRSESMSWLFKFGGLDVRRLNGGYKAYRQHCRVNWSEIPYRLIVLGGKTGSAKTEILHALKRLGEQIVDLEGLADHYGSAFGNLSEKAQPTVEQFENNLYLELSRLNSARLIWIENESKSIGQVYIPDGFWNKMKSAPLINLQIDFQIRLDYLVEQYGHVSGDLLGEAFKRITKRLGGQNVKEALEALEMGNVKKAAAIALHYYDKAYQFGLDKNVSPHIHAFIPKSKRVDEIATELTSFAQEFKKQWFD